MVQLFLNNTQVYPDSTQQIKITRENAYFTQSDSYTLDVSLPMDILENRTFFHSLHRPDAGKRAQLYDCRLLVDNRSVLVGTARLSQVTNDTVKVQLASGLSALYMTTAQQETYIDQMQLGDLGGLSFPVWDETHQAAINTPNRWRKRDSTPRGQDVIQQITYPVTQPRLIDVFRAVLTQIGYTVDVADSELPAATYIYIVTANTCSDTAQKLPHWTVRDFLSEFCNFFGIVLRASQDKVITVLLKKDFAGNDTQQLEVVEEYTTEVSDETQVKSAITDNLEYDFGGAGDRTLDCVEEELLDAIPTEASYPSYSAAYEAFSRSDSELRRMRKLYKCPAGEFVGWEFTDNLLGQETAETRFIRINPFAPLKRDAQAGTTKLRICPAPTTEDAEYSCATWGSEDWSDKDKRYRFNMPAVSNPYKLAARGRGRRGSTEGDITSDMPTVQEILVGDADLTDEEDKEDVMYVAFCDGVVRTVQVVSFDGETSTFSLPLAYTDYWFKPNPQAAESPKLSMSLNPVPDAVVCLGSAYHAQPFAILATVKQTFKFLADTIPDPTNIFLIRGHRYACEKIEASVADGRVDRLMTGYFYEML